MQKRKKENGITLIALVVTIIVLLILAGISIATLTGENGILTNAKDAREKTREANAKETVQVEVIGSYDADGKLNLGLLNTNLKRIKGLTHEGKTLDENPITSLPTEVELDGYTIEIDGEGNVKIVAGEKEDNDNDKLSITLSPNEDTTLTSSKEINLNIENTSEITDISIKANISKENIEEGIPSDLTLKNISTESDGMNKANAIILIGRSK